MQPLRRGTDERRGPAMLLNVTKMNCNHCVRSVTQAVRSVAPDAKVDVDLSQQSVRIEGTSDADAIVRAIEDEGYTAKVLEA